LGEGVELLLKQSGGSWVFVAKSETSPPERTQQDLLQGRYRLERKIGQGGFGTVYLASDERLHHKPVVVKLLTRARHDEWFEKKFSDEIKALARMDHPGVVGILDAGQTGDNTPFIVLQYIDGVTLRSIIAEGTIDRSRIALIVRQIGHALSAAHARGVLHRDLKPENIMLQPSPNGDIVRLIDFGIATIREHEAEANSTRVAGSIAYMAPEQLLGRPTFASDVFAMGIIACEMLTGKLPHREVDGVRLDHFRALQPDLPEDAIRVIEKAVRLEPGERYQSAALFGDQLAATLERDRLPGKRPELAPVPEDRKTAHDVYVSYASRDSDFASRLVGELEKRGARCFVATRDGAPGGTLSAVMDAAVQNSAALLLIVTDSANSSVQTAREIEAADRHSTPVIAVKLEGAEPSGVLSYFLSNPEWLRCSIRLDRNEVDAMERSVSRHTGTFSGSAPGPAPPAAKIAEPAEPLLSEFPRTRLPGRPGTRQVSVAAFFTGWALLTCVLSAVAHAAYITVTLQAQNGSRVPVRFGYLYELNGAFTFLFVVPCFIYFAVSFVRKAQAAVVQLASRDQIITKDIAKPAIAQIADANRRWMNKWVLGAALAITFLIIVGTEYLPPRSDYKHVMFGYVQAPWIAAYPAQCPQCTLGQLEQSTGRKIEPIGELNVEQLRPYRIAEPFYQRSGTAIERIGFVLFMISVLGLQVSVTVFVVWTILKAAFFLHFLNGALVASSKNPVELLLRFTDPAGMFGLEPVHRALTQLVGLIGASLVLQVLAWWNNALKGSRHALEQNLYTLGGWGQFLVSNYSVLLAILLLVYLFNINAITRESASEEANRFAAAPPRGTSGGRPTLEQILSLIEDQSIWRNARYTVGYIAAPVVYVVSILILNRSTIAYAVGDVWNSVLVHVLGKD
jgi:serine/threonine protein kinase